ncbi:MAG: HIT family protein, partial [Erysipelotrichaceae bacterium]|nr:HIT family protein [Erysipelotrichaceae bacterium]
MCIFCDIIEGKIPSKKIYEDEKCIAILDISQLTKGH